MDEECPCGGTSERADIVSEDTGVCSAIGICISVLDFQL